MFWCHNVWEHWLTHSRVAWPNPVPRSASQPITVKAISTRANPCVWTAAFLSSSMSTSRSAKRCKMKLLRSRVVVVWASACKPAPEAELSLGSLLQMGYLRMAGRCNDELSYVAPSYSDALVPAGCLIRGGGLYTIHRGARTANLSMYNRTKETKSPRRDYRTIMCHSWLRRIANQPSKPCHPRNAVVLFTLQQTFDSRFDINDVALKVGQSCFHVLDFGPQNVELVVQFGAK